MVKSHFIQTARENLAAHYDLHRFESPAERLQFIDSLLLDNWYHFHITENVDGGISGPNQTQRESKAANEWLASTLLPGRSNPAFYLHQIVSSGD
jgi:hypothetical protein